MDKMIWLLGGGIMQRPMAQEIKRRGYKLLITDLNPDCVCRELADQFEQVNIYSVKDNLAFAKTLIENPPAAVLTVATDAGVEVAWLGWHFSLPAVDPDAARKARNKAEMREAIDAMYPAYKTGYANRFGEWDIYPCIVKPNNSSGSRGLSVVHKPEDFQAALDKAEKANRVGELVIVEEMLEGLDTMPSFKDYDTSEVALDFLVYDGKVHYANGALRLFRKDRTGIEAGHINPYIPGPDIMRLAQDAASALGVDRGPFKLDLKRDRRYGWCILEAATRFSGGFDHMHTAPMATGKDITGAMLDYALGLPLDPDKLEIKSDGYVCAYAPVYEPGKIIGWEIDGINDVFVLENEEIKELKDNSNRPVFVLAKGEQPTVAYQAAKEAGEKVRPVYG